MSDTASKDHSSNLGATVFAMKQTLDELFALWSQVANKIDLTENGGKMLLFDENGNRLGAADVESIQNILKTTRMSISILNGTTQTEHYGNLFQAAQTNTDAMQFWSEYAQNTGEALQTALGAGKYNVSKFFASVAGEIATTVKETAEAANGSLPYIAVIAFVVLLVVLLK